MTPRRSHPDFPVVVVTVTPGQGVCKIISFGKDYSHDRYGYDVRAAFSQVRQQIEYTYGQSELKDSLEPGALWKGSNEWVEALSQHERIYQAVWERSPQSVLPNNVQNIVLHVGGASSDKSGIGLVFRFTNSDACEEEIKRAQAGVF